MTQIIGKQGAGAVSKVLDLKKEGYILYNYSISLIYNFINRDFFIKASDFGFDTNILSGQMQDLLYQDITVKVGADSFTPNFDYTLDDRSGNVIISERIPDPGAERLNYSYTRFGYYKVLNSFQIGTGDTKFLEWQQSGGATSGNETFSLSMKIWLKTNKT